MNKHKTAKRLLSLWVATCLVAHPVLATAASYQYQIPLYAPDMASAVPGQLQVTPGSYGFGTLLLGSTAAATTTIKNTGQDSVAITGIDVPAPFTQTNNCPSTLVGGASCSATVVFAPSSAGTFSGALSVAASSSGSTAFAVSGTAVTPTTDLTVSPNQVDFGAADVGNTATVRSVTITNSGNSPATVNGIGVTSGASDFAQSNNCGGELAPGSSCDITVSFTPAAYGPRSGNLSIFEQASGTLHSVALGGSGDAAILVATPSSVDLGTAIANNSSRTAQVTLSNSGNLALTGLTADVSAGDFSQVDSTCGASIAAGASCTVTVKFAPSAPGARSSTLLLATGNGGSVSVGLTGNGVAQAPSVQTSATSLVFADTVAGSSSAAKTVTFTNNGNVDVGISSVAATAGANNFQASSNCGTTLAVGASCTASVTFSPLQSGALAGTLSAAFSHTSITVSLSGTGTQGNASINPTSLSFPATQVASNSATQTVTVSNTGNRTLTFSGVGIASGTADFAQANDCAAVAPSATCTVNVVFTPSATGARTGTLAFVHDGVGATLVDLSGTGQAPSSTLSSLSFSATPVGATSTAVATLTNTGIGTLSVTTPSAASVTGTDFSFASTTCGASLAASGSCTVTVQFAPTSTTARSGQLVVNTGAGQQTAALSATGIQGFASVSPSSLSFAAQQNGTTSAAQSVTATNTGTNTLVFTGVGISSGASDFAQSNNCASLAPNATCTVSVTFTPSAAGARAGTVSLTHNGGGVTNVSLSGTGQAASATLSAPVWFSGVRVGSQWDLTATVTNTGIGPVTVTTPNSDSVTGTGFSYIGATCATASPLAAGGSCNIFVRFAPASAGVASGSLNVSTTAGAKTASLSATGVQGSASVNPTSLSFAAQQTGTSSTSQAVTLTNTGTSTLSVSSVSISAGATDFSQTNNCTSVAVSGSCTVNVTFTPSAAGARSGTVTLAHNGTGATSVSLSGTGQAPSATLSAIDFGVTQQGQAYGKTSTLSNTGISAISVTTPSAASVSGTYYSFASTTCGTSLASGATCTVTVNYNPGATGSHTGSLSFATGAGTQTAGLTASAQASTATLFTPTFANDYSGDATGDLKVSTLTNTGVGPLSLTVPSSASVTGTDFSFVSTTCTSPLAAGTSCDTTLKFQALGGGGRSGAFSITTGAGTKSVTLSGTGIAPTATLSTPSFASTPVGSNSNATATLTNTSPGAMSVTAPTATSVTGTDFSFVSTTCTASLVVSGTCTVTVKFSPTSTTERTGTLSVGTGAGTKTASLGSTGIQGYASMSPSSLTFAAQQVGDTGSAKMVVVSNTGTDTLTFTGVGISTGTSDYAQSNNCGSVAVNGTCTVNVNFTPSAAGTRAGTLSFTHNGGGIANVSLTGTGQAASATLTNPTFSATQVGDSSTATSTLTNTGIATMNVTVPIAGSVTGTDFSFVSTTCGTTLASGATCTVTVKFSPTSTAARSGTLSIVTEAGTKAATLSATGSAQSFAITTSLAFPTNMTPKSPSGRHVYVQNTGVGNITFSASPTSTGSITTLFVDSANTAYCKTRGTLAPNATCVIAAVYFSQAAGSYSGTMTQGSSAGNVVANITAGIKGNIDASDVAFADTQVGGYRQKTVTVSNTADYAVQNLAVSVNAPFAIATNNCGTTLAANSTCTVSVTFTPTAAQTYSGGYFSVSGQYARIFNDVENALLGSVITNTATLSGNGVEGNASLSPTSLSFSGQTLTTTSAAKSVTVTNTGTFALTITGVGVTAGASDYAQSNDCGTALAVDASCTINVSFTPSTTGTRTGTVSFTSNGTGATSFSLTGTGVAKPTLSSVAIAAANITTSGTSTFGWTAGTAASSSGSCTGAGSGSGTGTASSGSFTVTAGASAGTVTCTATAANSLGYSVTANDTAAVVAAPSVVTKNIAAANITVGGTNTFSWTTSGATGATVACSGTISGSGSGTSGTITVTAGSTAGAGTCTVTASNAAGATATGSDTTTVVAAPTLSAANIASSSVTVSGTSTFSWTATGATSTSGYCTGAGSGSGTGTASSGSLTMTAGASAGTVTCTANATNAAGSSVTRSDTASIVAAPVVNTGAFAASYVTTGGTAPFSWTTTSATSVSVACSGASTGSATSPLDGSLTTGTTGTGTGTCTITATNAAGSTASKSDTISVVAAPVVNTAAFATNYVTTGGTKAFSWTTTSATSVSVSCSGASTGSATSPLDGSLTTGSTGTGTGTCTVVSTNAAGSTASKSDTISVVAAPNVTGASFSPTSVTSGSNSTFSWTTSGASSASVSCAAPASGSGSGTSGSITVGTSGTGTGTCTVTASNAAGATATGFGNLTAMAAYADPSLTGGGGTCSTCTTGSMTFTLSNPAGNPTVSIASITNAGPGTIETGGTCAVGGTLAPGATCTVRMTVSFTSCGIKTGTLTIGITGHNSVTESFLYERTSSSSGVQC